MVGLYVGLALAYQKYQSYQAQLSSSGGALGLLSGLLK